MKANPHSTNETGPYGTAERVPIPADPKAAMTLTWWLITAPAFHPLWSQYSLTVVRLDDTPGFPPPVLHFDGATHELMVAALEPQDKPYTVATVYPLRWLEPINIVEQFTATDDEMRELAHLAAKGVVFGALNPETADAPTRIRAQWLSSLVKTLAHIRGEVHAA